MILLLAVLLGAMWCLQDARALFQMLYRAQHEGIVCEDESKLTSVAEAVYGCVMAEKWWDTDVLR